MVSIQRLENWGQMTSGLDEPGTSVSDGTRKFV